MTAVLGFIAQCAVCPQRALLDAQPDGDWMCPRCTEVAEPVRIPDEYAIKPRFVPPPGFGDIDVAQAEPVGSPGVWDGDEWWLKKVQG